MARFDLYSLPRENGYIVDVQFDHASGKLRTRVVVLLILFEVLAKPIVDLNPVVGIYGARYVFVAQSLATLTLGEMGQCVGSLKRDYADAFAYALDILLTGF